MLRNPFLAAVLGLGPVDHRHRVATVVRHVHRIGGLINGKVSGAIADVNGSHGRAHPAASDALQRDALSTETVLSPWLATYTVCVAVSIATPLGDYPTGDVRASARQPLVMVALQVSALTTDVVPASTLAA